MPDLTGKVISGRYEILEKLGEGGYATVWKAKQLQPEGIVAIKILLPEHAGDPELVAEFLREAGLYVDFRDDPNVATILECGEDEEQGLHYLVMTLLGDTVEDRIEKGPLPAGEVFRIARDMGHALEAVHAKKLVHRDIKCSNIMSLPDRDRWVLTDFGIGLVQESAEKTQRTKDLSSVSGTWSYASPEQIRAEKREDIGPQSDYYSLGVSLFRAATGEYPFPPKFPQVMFDHAEKEPPDPRSLNPEIPAGLADLILRCLKKNPADRFDSEKDFLRFVQESESRGNDGGPVGQSNGGSGGGLLPKLIGASVAALVLVLLGLFVLPGLIKGRGPAIQLTSDPPGAAFKLYQDQKQRFSTPIHEGTTPAGIKGLVSGSYALDLSMEGFFPLDGERIELGPGESAFPAAKLEKAQSIQVESTPPQARVTLTWLDETRMSYPSQPSPALIEGLHSGNHEVRVEKEGYTTWIDTVNVIEGTIPVRAVLAAAKHVRLWLFSAPEGATVRIDGGLVASLTNCEIPDIAAGPHRFQFSLDGYATRDTSMVVNFNQTIDTIYVALSKSAVVTPPPSADGGLMIASNPSGARIFLNGKDMQQKTPYRFEEFPTGRVALKLERGCYRTYSANLSIPVEGGASHSADLAGYPARKFTFTTTLFGDIYLDERSKPLQLKGMPPYSLTLSCGTHSFRLAETNTRGAIRLKYSVQPGSRVELLHFDWEAREVREK